MEYHLITPRIGPVAVTTARSQLQQAFIKTETNHQAELATLVHKALTHLRYDTKAQY